MSATEFLCSKCCNRIAIFDGRLAHEFANSDRKCIACRDAPAIEAMRDAVELTISQDAKLQIMANLCRRARVDCCSPRSAQARALDEAIRLVDPTWQPTEQLVGGYQSNGTKAAPQPWCPPRVKP